MAWIFLTSIMRLEVGHASNRRSMYTGGKQQKAPRLSRVSAVQFLRNLRLRFETWAEWLGLKVHPGEEEDEPAEEPATNPTGSWAFRIFVSERQFPSGGGPDDHDEEVELVNATIAFRHCVPGHDCCLL